MRKEERRRWEEKGSKKKKILHVSFRCGNNVTLMNWMIYKLYVHVLIVCSCIDFNGFISASFIHL